MKYNYDLSDNITGMIWMLAATIIFSVMHILIRYVSADIPPFEIIFLRNLFGVIILTPAIIKYGIAPLRTTKYKLLGGRAIINAIAMMCYFNALAISPLADVTALGFSAPIFATILAVIFFKEVIRLRRWVAIAVGFLGTMVILRPGIIETDTGMMLVLFSAIAWAITLHIIKILSKTESSLTITIYMVVMMTPITLIPAIYVWVWPTMTQILWLILIALLGTVAQFAMTQGMKLGDISVVMPIDFFRLIWVAILAWLIFAEIPDLFTWIGGAMIFASATYIAIRESNKRKK